ASSRCLCGWSATRTASSADQCRPAIQLRSLAFLQPLIIAYSVSSVYISGFLSISIDTAFGGRRLMASRSEAAAGEFGCSKHLAHHTHVWRVRMHWRRLLVVLALFGSTLASVASLEQPAIPAAPKEIAVPSGYKLLFHVEAKGLQIYKAVKASSGT